MRDLPAAELLTEAADEELNEVWEGLSDYGDSFINCLVEDALDSIEDDECHYAHLVSEDPCEAFDEDCMSVLSCTDNLESQKEVSDLVIDLLGDAFLGAVEKLEASQMPPANRPTEAKAAAIIQRCWLRSKDQRLPGMELSSRPLLVPAPPAKPRGVRGNPRARSKTSQALAQGAALCPTVPAVARPPRTFTRPNQRPCSRAVDYPGGPERPAGEAGKVSKEAALARPVIGKLRGPLKVKSQLVTKPASGISAMEMDLNLAPAFSDVVTAEEPKSRMRGAHKGLLPEVPRGFKSSDMSWTRNLALNCEVDKGTRSPEWAPWPS